jgi:hypothetical protein
MKTISFIGNSEPPHKLLEIFKKMTPGSAGIWGQLKGVPTYDSDYYGVIDCLPSNLKHFENRSVFLGAHPPTSHYSYNNMDNLKGIAKVDCREGIGGFLEWWLKYDYDYLKVLKPMIKTKKLGCIVSDAQTQKYHKDRRNWLERFTIRDDLNFNLHGRIKPFTQNMQRYYRGCCGSIKDSAEYKNDHMSGKEEVYEQHKYMIEFDATGKFYISERILDCLLMWSMPIYYGGENLHKYIPKESFHYLDINGDGIDVIDIINSNLYEKSLSYIGEARNLLLDKWQLWPRLHELIFGSTI